MLDSKSLKRLFSLVGRANAVDGVGGKNKDTLRVLMPNDVALIDETITDYNGRICLVNTPAERGNFYQRVFIDGGIAIICDPTDGEENGRYPLDKVKFYGVLVAIVREMQAEEQPSAEKWAEFCEKYPVDKLINYYPFDLEYLRATKVHHRGDGAMCFIRGYQYGFSEGRRAERNSKRRERRKKAKQHG